jgi:prepilin-type N-terminal cleavage/methylation domain-containing protein
MKRRVKNDQAGFTLIEYIVTLVIAAIVAAMVSTFFGKTITESVFPILNLQKGENLHRVMENIVGDYNRLHTIDLRNPWKASTPYTVNACIVPSANNGYYYKCTTDAAISGTSEPSWPTTANGTVTDGGIAWINSGKVWKAATAYVVDDIVIPYNNNGHYYKCTTGGTSAAGGGPS